MASTSALKRRDVLSWAFYDVANSSFTTLVVTFIYSTYFVRAMEPGTDLTSLWTIGASITAITVASLSPLMGALADRGGYRRRFLLAFSAVCVVATAALYFVGPGMAVTALVLFVMANIAFEMSSVFYDSFLPDLASQQEIGMVSGFAWGIGYVGGIFALLIALLFFVLDATPLYHWSIAFFNLDVSQGENIRATNLLVAVWFALFTLPFILYVKEPPVVRTYGTGNVIVGTYRQLAETFREIRRYRQIVRLLVARLVYNDGLIVIFTMGAIFAQAVYGFAPDDIIVFGIVLNITAGIGAIAFGYLDDKIGGKPTILIALAGLSTAGLIALTGSSTTTFWVASAGIGLLVGPVQAASRSLLGRFVPDDKEAEFYGFFAFSGKATAFLGTLLYGQFTLLFNSHRAGMFVAVLFFVVGGLLLLRVNEQEGIELSGRSGPPASL